MGKRNFGDANMDISGRALLKGLGYDIDLFTHPNLHELFGEDDVFSHVFSNVEDIKERSYDFVLLSEFNHPSIRFKTKHFRNLPFACLFRFFYGPARNQTCFSYAAVNRLFNLKLSPAEIETAAKPYLHHHADTEQSISHVVPGQPYLAISIGGRDADRSYRHWPEFLRLLDEQTASGIPRSVMLLGSDNGLEMDKAIARNSYKNLVIQSQVGKLSLLQSRVLIAHAAAFIGCDGGLMHVAHSTSTPSVTLFRLQEPHHLWLTRSCHSRPIQSSGEDSEIAPEQILHELLITLNLQTS
jgi:heptosyltransferase-2